MQFYNGWDEFDYDNDTLDICEENINLLNVSVGEFIQAVEPHLLDGELRTHPGYEYDKLRTFCKMLQLTFNLDDPCKILQTLANIIINDEGYFKWDNVDRFNECEANPELISVERAFARLCNSVEGYVNNHYDFQVDGSLGCIPCLGNTNIYSGKMTISLLKKYHPEYLVGVIVNRWSPTELFTYSRRVAQAQDVFNVNISSKHQFRTSAGAPRKNATISQFRVENQEIVYVPLKYFADSVNSGNTVARCYSWLPENILRDKGLPILKSL